MFWTKALGHLTCTILLLKQMTGLEILSGVSFMTACFWVKAYDVPGIKQTTTVARTLASHIGELVSCDETTMKGVEKSICFWVDVDISKPLQRGINVVVAGKPIWIRFKYVKLLDFCHGCGKLGHLLKGCDTIDAEEDDPNLQHGTWLRASPLKSWRRNAESDLLEEKKNSSLLSTMHAVNSFSKTPPSRTLVRAVKTRMFWAQDPCL